MEYISSGVKMERSRASVFTKMVCRLNAKAINVNK